ncbi:MAG: hypothetical protein IT223_11860 [Crocinitomicaceae bacterium]|nr:hypothetical protein [Crocinitomicaceae bacterium]
MIKAEPRTILTFLYNYFEVVRDLFEFQTHDGIITREDFDHICQKHGPNIKNRLREYRIIRPVGSDYEMRDVYFKMMEFLLLEFKPLLPETIEKYKGAITELFLKIRKGEAADRDILQERIKNLSRQVREFVDLVERNAFRLLNETRDLKSNIDRIEYKDKVHKASFWIEYYILPLNKILDVNHSESVTNKLVEVSEYANRRRLDFADESVRLEFEKLYIQLIQTNTDLLRQSKILTNELLPLLERIRTESLILTGWIEFLRNPYKVETPPLLKGSRTMVYAKDMLYKVREFFEQFQQNEAIVFEDDTADFDKWIFDRDLFKSRLQEQLPVNDFFNWCVKMLAKDFKEIETEKFFAMTGLLFDEDLSIEFPKKNERTTIMTTMSKISVPKLKVEPALKIR